MALKINFQHTPTGFDSPAVLTNAYARVDSIEGTKNNLFVIVSFYNKKTDELVLAKQSSYQFQPSVESGSLNFIAQSYSYLKTLPDFVGAVDC